MFEFRFRTQATCIGVLFLLAIDLPVGAQTVGDAVATGVPIQVTAAKGSALQPRAAELVALVTAKQFAAVDQKATALRQDYEALFDTRLKQFTFQDRAEWEEFKRSSPPPFEWIDWGYKTCLQMQAFAAAERQDFPAALALLRIVEAVAPISAETAVETGYILNQMAQPVDGLASYREAFRLAETYASQRPFRAMALRGIGFSLIELGTWDEAERAFLESLDIDAGNQVALSELAYIRKHRE